MTRSPGDVNRTHNVSLRFSDVEYERLRVYAKRHGCSVPEVLRRLALNAAVPLTPPPDPPSV